MAITPPPARPSTGGGITVGGARIRITRPFEDLREKEDKKKDDDKDKEKDK
jgi:hypothetical protein